ncbi:unnamed protein product [Adineta ricciae]|uniref:Uncharacterized protein n=1 Tax=Adineta ricciae TaxID=249248 RepID=A0A815MDI6_ADIRI|nr:unnamed protein product [Adineta ricciae]
MLVAIIGLLLTINSHVLPIDEIPRNKRNDYGMLSVNRTRLISTILEAPFMMLKHNHNETFLEQTITQGTILDPSMVEGYCADLAYTICHEKLNISYKFFIETKYGHRATNGVWTGIMGALINHKADLAVAPLIVNAAREKLVDFTLPFMTSDMSMIMLKPAKQKPELFFFLFPMSKTVWFCVLLSYILVSIILLFINRIINYEYYPQNTYDTFSMCTALCFPLTCLMHWNISRSIAGRVAISAWWLFCLIFFAIYIAGLIALYPFPPRMISPIESLEDLSKQTTIRYGILKDSSTMNFFNKSNDDMIQNMWNFMQKHKDDAFVTSYRVGIEKVRQSKGRYVFLAESTFSEYINERLPCDIMVIRVDINSKEYGIVTPLKSDLRKAINVAVLELHDNGFLKRLKQKWFYERSECTKLQTKNDLRSMMQLHSSHMAGVFYVLIFGLGLAIIIAFFEFLSKAKHDSIRLKQNFGKVMCDNLRNSIKSGNIKQNTSPSTIPVAMEASKNNKAIPIDEDRTLVVT